MYFLSGLDVFLLVLSLTKCDLLGTIFDRSLVLNVRAAAAVLVSKVRHEETQDRDNYCRVSGKVPFTESPAL